MRLFIKTLLVISMLLTCVCMNLSGQTQKPKEIPLMANEIFNNTKVLRFYSEHLNDSIDLVIKLPAGYTSSQSSFPLMMVLDADVMMGVASETSMLLSYEGNAKQMITVGISYGSLSKWSSSRGRDLTPSNMAVRPKSGNAPNLLAFIKKEALTYIEENFRINAEQKILYGHSYGGLFTLYALIDSPDTFTHYIATSPSVNWDNENLIEELKSATNDDYDKKLFLSIGSQEDNLKPSFNRLIEALGGSNFSDLQISVEEIPKASHMSSIPMALILGLLSFSN